MFQEILQTSYFRNTVLTYLTAFGIFIGSIIIIQLIKLILLSSLKKWSKKTKTALDDFLIKTIEKPLIILLYFGALYFACLELNVPLIITKGFKIFGLFLITVFSVRITIAVVNYAMQIYWIKKEKDINRLQGLRGIRTVIKIIIWIIAAAILLDNLGVKISALVAGLGIGGIAIALAAQAILGDLFNFFAIFFDKPFEIGDFIILEGYLGTVEHIGIKTTRVRSLSGEQLVFSNTDLTNSRVRNYKRMQKRRVLFKLGVTYQTSLEQAKNIPLIIKNTIESLDAVTFDRAHFASYGDFNLNYEIVYFVLSSDYNKYMDIQQEINFKIKEEFEKNGIEFAYPTQSLYVEKK
ncbi:mechanosensitive ion channel family protein [bacterium]